jgi:hypothetical protein
MSRLEAWLLHLSTIVLTITGIVYAWMHYLTKPGDPFSVVNHPLEPYLMDIHIVVAPFLVFAVGIIVRSHIRAKLENGNRTARRSGILLILLFTVMVLSGYLLQILSVGRTGLVVVHLTSGFLWALCFLSHQIASYRVRRALAQNGSPRTAGNAHLSPQL